MLNNYQWCTLLRNLTALETILDERIHREFQQTGYDSRTRKMIEQRIDVHRLSAWIFSLLSEAVANSEDGNGGLSLAEIRQSPLAASCWEVLSEYMPFTAFALAGDCGCDKRDSVPPDQMMLPF